jgi:Reverse transcriptase (RNA-dependent DNA polymerase)
MAEGTGDGSSALSTVVSPIVANIEYPVLKKLGKQNIRKFLTDRDAYVREIDERSAQGNGRIGRPVSLAFSIDPSVLLSLVELQQFGAEVTKVESVTDSVLLTWLEKHRDLKKDGLSAAQVQAIIFKSLRMNMSEKDPEQRIIMLFADYKNILRVNGISWLVDKNPKMAVHHITEALKPSILRKRVKDDLTFSYTELERDFIQFMKHVIGRAEHYADYEEPEQMQQTTVKSNAGPGHSLEDSSAASGKGRGSKALTKNASHYKATSEGKTKSLPDCLNPECSMQHYLKECQHTTQARKDELYAKLAERRKANGEQRNTRRDTSGVAVSASMSSLAADRSGRERSAVKVVRDLSEPAEGRLRISFLSAVDCIALPDSGADDNVIPRSVVQSLENKGIFVPLRTMKDPVHIELAFQAPGLKAQVQQQAQLTVELHLAAGPLRLRNCTWLVVDYDMDEVLLGWPLLEALGLDAQKHLSAVRDSFQDMDCSKIQSLTPGGKLTRLLLREPDFDQNRNSYGNEEPLPGGDATKTPPFPTTTGIPVSTYATPVITASLFAPEIQSDIISNSNGSNTTQAHGDSVTYGEQDIDPIDVPQLLDLPTSAKPEGISDSFDVMIRQAQQNGLPDGSVLALGELLNDFADIWSTSLHAGPPAKLPPLVINLKPDAIPVRVRLRRYSQEQRDFLKQFVSQLEAAGLIYRNPRAAWCSAPLLVPKPGPAQFRFTVDLRPVNRQTVPCSWPMPHVESELARLCNSHYFATFDLSHGYWQLPLAAQSQECQSFITPDGVYSPTRVLHGTTNAVAHMQSVLQEVLAPMSEHILAWLDDLLLHAASITDLFDYLRTFFTICRNYSLKLHPGKCVLFSASVRWCGRVISATGSKFDPRRIQGLIQMPLPTTGADLQQFTCALNWMRTAIPSFSTLVAPLHQLLEDVYARAGGRRTKTSVARIPLSEVGWTDEHAETFRACQKALVQTTELSHPSKDKRVCLYTDASQDFWSPVSRSTSRAPSFLVGVVYGRYASVAYYRKGSIRNRCEL